MEHYDIIIVGGGISGLAFAYECEKAGLNYIVLESSSRCGGSIHSFVQTDHDGQKHVFELGPHTLYNNYGYCIKLIEELRLGIVEKKKNRIFFKEQEHSTSMYSLFNRFRFLTALFSWIACQSSRIIFGRHTSPTTLKEKFKCLLGETNYHRVVAPALKALFNQPIDSIPENIVFRRRTRQKIKHYPARFSIAGGNESLIKELAAKLHISLNTPVENICVTDKGFECISHKRYSCHYVALAVPANVLCNYKEILHVNTSPLTVTFQTTVMKQTQTTPNSITVFEHQDQYSHIAFDNHSNSIVCHSSEPVISEDIFLSKKNILPNLNALGQVDARVDNIFLLGNYFGGMSLEDCLQHSISTFQILKNKKKGN